jgi:glutathione reductase (NADPH)
VVYRGENILRGFDDEVRAHLRGELEKRGIRILTKRVVKEIAMFGHELRVVLSDNDAVAVEQAMFATGRKPNISGIGLEAAGVKIGPNGGIAVDEFSQTSVPSVYAVGDVTNRVNLTPVAIREGHAFADSVFGGKPTRVDHADVPTAVFSEPEVGVIGLTEAEACRAFAKVDVYKTSFRPMKATLAGRDTRVFMKLVVDGQTDRVVGCHIVGPEAGEMIQLIGIAVKMKATKADFDATMALHPTAAEELVTMREKSATHVRQAAE